MLADACNRKHDSELTMQVQINCSVADLYLIAKAFQMAEMQADRNYNQSWTRTYRRKGRTTVSRGMDIKRSETFEYQRQLFGELHDMFLDAIPEQQVSVKIQRTEEDL